MILEIFLKISDFIGKIIFVDYFDFQLYKESSFE